MEWFLEHLLPARTREEVVGDLREEYIEAMLPRRGRLRANLWYAGHALSLVPGALSESRKMGKLLIFTSGFTMIWLLWLARMELSLRHGGYQTRMALDICFAISCLGAGYLRILARPRTRSETALRANGLLMAVFGALTFLQNAHATHFEGYLFVISLSLMAEGILMLLVLGRSRENRPGHPAR
jgi:hypothetical protein